MNGYVSKRAAAKELGVDEHTIRGIVAAGGIKVFRPVGTKRAKYCLADLRKAVAAGMKVSKEVK